MYTSAHFVGDEAAVRELVDGLEAQGDAVMAAAVRAHRLTGRRPR